MGPMPSKARCSPRLSANPSRNGSKQMAALPPPMEIVKREGRDPTRAFASFYRKHVAFLNEVFKPDDNEQTVYPPTIADEFVLQRFAPAPEFHRLLARELWTLIREIGRRNNTVNGSTL